ncbi:MAG: asparagine synthase (glutamine-hydrolyzing) [Terriglobales bacterium]
MCGIAGFLDASGQRSEVALLEIAQRMSDALAHRGPDDQGHWADPSAGIALGFRRLSIIDVSPTGHQPMVSAGGRFVIIFNGEIYNYDELRSELLRNFGAKLRGTSDTEVMLLGFDSWGVEQTLRRLNGMFALAIWDRAERTLYLCRDRLGEKPLYYGWMGGTLLFASELKSFHQHPQFQPELNTEILPLYLRYGYVPTPASIYKNVNKLPPATFLKIAKADADATPQKYWSMEQVVIDSREHQFPGSLEEAVGELSTRLKRSVKQRMQADVPLGAFLSGGIDSSTIVALMQEVSSRPVHTFSIGFQEDSYNEARDAERVARHLHTEHTEFYISSAQAMEIIPRLPELFDEPFADSSQIPTFLISQLARRHVTVALTGDGGDEVFGGYNRYLWHGRIWNVISRVPRAASSALGGAVTLLSPAAWDTIFTAVSPLLPKSMVQRLGGQKIHKLANILRARTERALYQQISSISQVPSELLDERLKPVSSDFLPSGPEFSDFIEEMMYLDTITYLPDDILAKVDRASMGASLETRAPFVDHEIVEFAWSLPLSMKVRGGVGKQIVRNVLSKFVPSELTDRPKTGFGVPLGGWLRGELRDWAEAALDANTMRSQGLLDVAAVHKKWHEHLSGAREWQYQIWTILMLQTWLQRHSTDAARCAEQQHLHASTAGKQ